MARPAKVAKTLAAAFDRVATPVYVLDSERRLVFANAAFSSWAEGERPALVGELLEYAPGSGEADALRRSSLCPPAQAFSTQTSSGTVAAQTDEGDWDRRPATFIPLLDTAGQLTQLLVVVHTSQQAIVPAPDEHGLDPQLLRASLLELRGRLHRSFQVGQFFGTSAAAKRILAQAKLAATAGSHVVIVGRPGSGRRTLARAIHAAAPRWLDKPLLMVDCELLVAETVSAALSPGGFRMARTPADPALPLLLAGIDRLPEAAQVALEIELARLPAQTLIMATSRVPLERLVKRGTFSATLAQELSVQTIRIPSLKTRTGDIPLLAQYYVEARLVPRDAANGSGERTAGPEGFTADALQRLIAYDWPGETQELKELVTAAAMKCKGALITAEDLPTRLHHAEQQRAHQDRGQDPIKLDELLSEIETQVLKRALRMSRGNKTKAADWLSVSRARLIRRLVQLGLITAPAEQETVVFEPIDDTSEKPTGGNKPSMGGAE